MKKFSLSLLIVLVLVWSCGTVFAQGRGKGKDAGEQGKQAQKVQKKDQPRQVDANEPPDQGKGKRMRDQQRLQRQEQIRRQIREMRRRVTEKPRSARDANRPPSAIKGDLEPNQPAVKLRKGRDKGKGKGREHQQQVEALKKQMVHEEAKHRKRVARLKRIRELAVEEGSTETIERVDKLLEKEQQRYERKHERMRMEGRKRKTLQLTEKGLSEEAKKKEPNVKEESREKAEGEHEAADKEAEE